MPAIYPKVTRAKLKNGARKTSAGKGRVALPGVKTDAKHVNATDKCGYKANRELAAMIRKAVQAKKNADKQGEHQPAARPLTSTTPAEHRCASTSRATRGP